MDYAKARKRLKNGDVLLYKGQGPISWIIKKVTKSEYSHSGIVVWWNNRLMVMEARSKKGVIVSPLSRSICGYKGTVEWYTAKKRLTKKERQKMVEYAEIELGKKYNTSLVLVDLIAKLFKITGLGTTDTLGESSKQFCSYYVAQIYNSIGLDLTPNKNDCFMSPDDIARSKALDKVGIIHSASEAVHDKHGPCYKYKRQDPIVGPHADHQ